MTPQAVDPLDCMGCIPNQRVCTRHAFARPSTNWIVCHRPSMACTDRVSSAIHGLHGMSSMPNQTLDPVSSAIHGLHGMSSS